MKHIITKFKKLDGWKAPHGRKSLKTRLFGRLTMCKECYTFYYKHSWHFYKPKQLVDQDDSTLSVHFTKCPACLAQDAVMEEPEYSMGSSRLSELSHLS